MQNKPNLLDAQMNVSSILTKDYENKWQRRVRKNKPNSNPNKPNFRRARMNINSLITKDYRKKDDFAVQKNKPNSNPISVKAKMNVKLYVIEDYENETTLRPKKTNPNKANFTYPQRGKTEVRCRFSEVRYLSSAFCFLSSVHGHLLVNRMKPKLLNFHLKIRKKT